MFVSIDLDCPHSAAGMLPGFDAALREFDAGRYEALSANSRPVYDDVWTRKTADFKGPQHGVTASSEGRRWLGAALLSREEHPSRSDASCRW